MLTDEAVSTLQLDPAKYKGKNTTILYWQVRCTDIKRKITLTSEPLKWMPPSSFISPVILICVIGLRACVCALRLQGPVQDRNYKGNFTSLATFTTEIHSLHTPYTTGQQVRLNLLRSYYVFF